MSELPKTFDPGAIESRWYSHWEESGAFRPSRPDAEPFTIVNPPPNVTGSLHIGHALDNTLQDILVRHARMQGKDALWVVGTDHAGIATQSVVERQLEAQQDKRTNYSRDDFIAKVWEWKAESGGTITRQLRRLGCSMDWSREQFTMDPHFSRAVTKVFVDLYNQGLLYRDKRLVNWDPGLKTAISDLEVETTEVAGKFWHFRYPLADGSGHISVATTRPETMFADMAVAVSPGDPRYSALVGKMVRLPITGREIPIIEDEHADPELGSGAVKITPGHDFNDFEVGKRAGLKPGEMLNMLDAEAKVVQCGGIPDELLGLDRFEARTRVVELIDAVGLLDRVEDRTIATPFGDRSGVVIEPWLTDQWYVDAETLAQPAIAAVRDGRIEIVPKSWEKTFFNWMENIQPWCVSRQLWWGHRIPAWYGDDGKFFVAESESEAVAQARSHYSSGRSIAVSDWASARDEQHAADITLIRDEDVLDTWFSSALWPFATLGWPEPSPLQERGGSSEAAEGEGQSGPSAPLPTLSPEGERAPLLHRHYPNDVLVSGFDILFFWDARMAMQGMHFMGEPPWKTLYLHGLVRAADGQKMSKSKGNTVDPLILMDKYGTDALRFFMAAMESQGRDIKMDEKRVEGYRNFATKLWNAARFCQANGIGASQSVAAPQAALAVNKWIIGEVVETLARLDRAFAEFRFDGMADAIYHFTWGSFCDWYLELIKGAVDDETKVVAGWVLDQILVMLHPFMPFITEELWHAMGERPYDLIVARWPEPQAALDTEAEVEIRWLINFATDLRRTRTETKVAPKTPIFAAVLSATEADQIRLNRHHQRIARLTNVIGASVTSDGDEHESHVSVEQTGRYDAFKGNPVQFVTALRFVSGTIELFGHLTRGFSDESSERDSLQRTLVSVSKEFDSLTDRLANSAFVERAKPEAVEKARADHAEKAAEVERLQAALSRLG